MRRTNDPRASGPSARTPRCSLGCWIEYTGDAALNALAQASDFMAIETTAARPPLTVLSDEEALFRDAVAEFAEEQVRPRV